jgi:hypothetical protein
MKYCETHETAMERLAGCARIYPNLCDVDYFFFGPWGRINMTYAQYLFSPEMRVFLNSKKNYRLELGRRIYCYPKEQLAKDGKLREALSTLENEKKKNPLQFFMPNGTAGLSFLNDRKSTIKMIVAGNRYGKTCLGIIDMLLDIFPCDPNWPIFSENGVRYRPWSGKAVEWGAASYTWRHITTTVAPLIINWAPESKAQNGFCRQEAVHRIYEWIESAVLCVHAGSGKLRISRPVRMAMG